MNISLPEQALVVLIGPSSSGKSTLARRHFRPTEILSSDACRAWVCDDEVDQTATQDAFEVLRLLAAKRLTRGKLTVIDATNVYPEDRRALLNLARQFHVAAIAIVLDLPPQVYEQRNQERSDRRLPPHVLHRQVRALRESLGQLKREGFAEVYIVSSVEQLEGLSIQRYRLSCNRRDLTGPFDIIGDVHGCYDELVELLQRLGYSVQQTETTVHVNSPSGRMAVFLGDLVDRGPACVAVLQLVMSMVENGTALCVPGNHDVRLVRALRGARVRVTHGLAETLRQLEAVPQSFRQAVVRFLDGLPSHYVLDQGRLVVAHAGLPESLQGRDSGRVRQFALYGETTGETDEFGLPVRHDWTADYQGQALVVYGHTPVVEPLWVKRTLCVDTGCVFGGQLTALRYPERECVSVPARRVYYPPLRPLAPTPQARPTEPPQEDDLLDIGELLGKRFIHTRTGGVITVRAECVDAALEVMGRLAVDPHWLIYLPPSMAPIESNPERPYLESPEEAFAYYVGNGVHQVICQEKLAATTVVVVLCRDNGVPQRRFGYDRPCLGMIYSRTAQRVFPDAQWEHTLLATLADAAEKCGLWQTINSDWMCLEGDLLPWSLLSQSYLKAQGAAVGAAGTVALTSALALLDKAMHRKAGNERVLKDLGERLSAIGQFIQSYRPYCRPVDDLCNVRLMLYHLLASEGRVHVDKPHVWHLEHLAALADGAPSLLVPTVFRQVNLQNDDDRHQAVLWWQEMETRGSKGMVIKPQDWLPRCQNRLIQPALLCRCPGYLRLIYGPQYQRPENLERLRHRPIPLKRAMAIRQYSLALEALHRFVEREPLSRVHECIFGTLGLASEPVDPRL
jgi:protein phosphatase